MSDQRNRTLPARAGTRARLGAVFLGFLLLVAGSVGATFVSIRTQAADALVINLAGRQRMLAQEMGKATLGLAYQGAAQQGIVQSQATGYRTELQQAAYLFDRTLEALRHGGPVRYGDQDVTLPAATDAAVRAQLDIVSGLWDQLRPAVEGVAEERPEATAFAQVAREVERLTPTIVNEMDRAVRLTEAAAVHKLHRLRFIQVAFFASAVGLLGLGYLVTERTIVHPLSALKDAICQIAGGDLDSPTAITPAANGEVLTLANSFEEMRTELALARHNQDRWTAQLEARVRERTEQLAALFELSTEISSELDTGKVLQTVVDKTRQLAGGEVAVLCLLDPPAERVTVAATSGAEDAFVSPPHVLTAHSPEFTVGDMEQAIQREGANCPILRAHFLRSHLAVPLHVGNRVVGGLCVGHREASRFGEEQVRLLTLLADAGAIAMENARAYERAEQEARLIEREHILAEIHDGLAQTLSFLDLRMDVVKTMIESHNLSEVPEHLALTQRTIVQAEREVRRLMGSLQADEESHLTFEAHLRQVIAQFAVERQLEIEVRSESELPIRSPIKVREQVHRVVLEALTNVTKHAPNSNVTITLKRQDGQAAVCIRDNGPGIDLKAALDKPGHFGLKVMQARAERIGGALTIEPAPGCGTLLTLSWPVQE